MKLRWKKRLLKNRASSPTTWLILRDELFTNFITKDFVDARISGAETKIAEAKFQIILWAFVFGATQLGAVFAFLKFLK